MGGYFFLNRFWTLSRRGALFSHSSVHWTDGTWVVRVWYWRRWRRPWRRRWTRRLRFTPRWQTIWIKDRPWKKLIATRGVAQLWSQHHPGAQLRWTRLGGIRSGGVPQLVWGLRYRLVGRIELRARRVVIPLLRAASRLPGVRGVHVRCNGRFTRRQRAGHEVFQWGALQRSRVNTRVQTGFYAAPLRFGSVGVTLTVSFA